MIGKRAREFVRQRDWVGTAFELLIVALGVLLGIQASNWNDDRLRNARQGEVLSQLGAELDQTIAEADQRIAFGARTVEEIGVVISAAESGHVDPEDDAKFRSGLNLLDGWWKPAWRLGTVDELISKGELDLIPDARLRAGLIAYRDTVNVIRGDLEMMVADIYQHMPTVVRHVRFDPTRAVFEAKSEADMMNADLFDVSANPADLHADHEVLNALSAIRRDQVYALGNQITVREEAVALREQLKAVQGPAPPPATARSP